MKSKSFIKKFKHNYYKKGSFIKKFKFSLILLLILFPLMSFKSWKGYDIVNVGITSISILFGFALSFFLTIYTNRDLNLFFKKHNMFLNFIEDNKEYLFFLLRSVIYMYILSLTTSYEYKINFTNLHISMYLSTVPIIFVIGMVCFFKTSDFLDKYIIVYKNTYSDRVLNEKTLNK